MALTYQQIASRKAFERRRAARSHSRLNSASSDRRERRSLRTHHCPVDQVAEGAAIATAL
jgi:hypothetical protein